MAEQFANGDRVRHIQTQKPGFVAAVQKSGKAAYVIWDGRKSSDTVPVGELKRLTGAQTWSVWLFIQEDDCGRGYVEILENSFALVGGTFNSEAEASAHLEKVRAAAEKLPE